MAEDFTVREWQDVRVLEYSSTGPQLGNAAASLEMIGAARVQNAEWIAIPIERLGEDFFNLRNGVAGEVLQKFVTYQIRVAIVGETSLLNPSKALRDFVIECNRGATQWFVSSMDELKDRLRRETCPAKDRQQ